MTEITTLIAGATLGKLDAEVVLAMDRALHRPSDAVATWRVGIRNDDGVIYRVVTLRSLDQWLDFLEDMERLGLVDELEDALDLADGFDSILRHGNQGQPS
jgi:hypothetical protein